MTGESRRRAGGKTRGIHGCGISDHRVTSTEKRPAQYEKRTSNRRILGYLLTALTAICIPIMTAVLTSYTKSALGQGSGSSLSANVRIGALATRSSGGDVLGPYGLCWNPHKDIPITGDWDGRGTDEPGYVQGNVFYLGHVGPDERVTNYREVRFGRGIANGDTPITGDWNGDGITDIGVVHDGQFIEAIVTPQGQARQYQVLRYGGSIADGYIPITGAWGGHNLDEPGYVRNGDFLLGQTGPGQIVTDYRDLLFGDGIAGKDIPVTGDWKGDGMTGIGVVRRDGFHVALVPRSSGKVREWKTLWLGNGIGNGDIPLIGEWGHDGVSSPGVVRGDQFLEGSENPLAAVGEKAIRDLVYGPGAEAHLPVSDTETGALSCEGPAGT
jgi:hypothetical protein